MIGGKAEGRGLRMEVLVQPGIVFQPETVIPAKAGIHFLPLLQEDKVKMDPGFRRDGGQNRPGNQTVRPMLPGRRPSITSLRIHP